MHAQISYLNSLFPFLTEKMMILVTYQNLWKIKKKNPLCVCMLSCVRLFAAPQTIAHQTLLSMEFSRQEYWSGLLCPPPGDLPDPGTEPMFPALPVDTLPSEPPGKSKNTGVGTLLQGIFPNQGLLHCRQVLYH